MMEFFLELVGMLVFEFGDFVIEQKVAKQAKYRHFYFWGGWLSCLAVLIVTGIIGLATWAIFAISVRDGDFGWMLLLGIFLAGMTVFGLWRLYRTVGTMCRLTKVYLQ